MFFGKEINQNYDKTIGLSVLTFIGFAFFLSSLGSWPCYAEARVTGTPFSFVAPGVAYHPRDYAPKDAESVVSVHQVQKDLGLLKETGFRGLVTYASSGVLGSVPQIARQMGFDGTIVMGIWDPDSNEEWENAVSQSSFVDGYCLGNEGLGVRYDTDLLGQKMAELRRATNKPVTTSEPIDSYLVGPYRKWLLANSDWLFPLAHPVWAAQPDPENAINWIVARHDFLVGTTGQTVILKEVGIPTKGIMGYHENSQLAFFELLEGSGMDYFYFEAFDQPWKRTEKRYLEAEAHWGLYKEDGTPKQVVHWLAGRLRK